MMRSKVDLPQPEAPIRQMNSPLAIERLASASALIVWSCSLKTFDTLLISTIGMVASAMMVGLQRSRRLPIATTTRSER